MRLLIQKVTLSLLAFTILAMPMNWVQRVIPIHVAKAVTEFPFCSAFVNNLPVVLPVSNAFLGCYGGWNYVAGRQGSVGHYVQSYALERVDQQVNFDWGNGSPVSVNDDFWAIWRGNFTFAEAGDYAFSTLTDDGVRVFVDGQKIIDYYVDQSATKHSTTIPLSAGTHEIQMDYYENAGDAVANLSWNRVSQISNCSIAASNTFKACYFSGKDSSKQLKLSKTDAAPLQFDWGSGSPDTVVPKDNFSAVWLGTFNFDSGAYEFNVTADDGVRLFVDGNLILDKWIDQSSANYKVPFFATPGPHTVKLDYYENGGDSVAKLSWTKTAVTFEPCQAGEVGYFSSCYYDNINFTAFSHAQTNKLQISPNGNIFFVDYNWGGGSPAASMGADQFSAHITGNAYFHGTGKYWFYVAADDGVRVYIDGQIVLDKWVDQHTSYDMLLPLTSGVHTITVDYYENFGDARVSVGWDNRVQ